MSKILQAIKFCLPFFLLSSLLIFFVRQHPFFWDTVLQSSKWADYFYQSEFKSIFLPAELDAGHPPFFAYYLALVWQYFGKTLLVSHLAVLPFVFGIIWQFYQIIQRFFDQKHHWFVMLLVLTDATLLAQSSLVSPDIVLVFGFLLALNGILKNNAAFIVFGTSMAALVSIRGIFAVGSLFLIHQLYLFIFSPQRRFRNHAEACLTYLPVILVIGAYYYMHYQMTGWVMSTPNADWSQHRQLESVSGILRNVGILGWRIMDFGRVGIVLILAVGIFISLFKKIKPDKNLRFLIGSIILFILAYSPALLLIRNPIAHRYLMPLYLLISIACAYLLFQQFQWKKWARGLCLLMLLIQLSGHFWIYPRHMAQGWDASLAYIPYFDLRQQMLGYLDDQQIAVDQVGSEFPNIGAMKYIDLSQKKIGFLPKDLDKQAMIFYSNVYNDFSDTELDLLDKNFVALKTFEKRGIQVILYRKK